MRIIQLSQTNTGRPEVYLKRAIIVCTTQDELSKVIGRLREMTTFKRRKRVYLVKTINEFLPSNVWTPLIYVEYKYKESLHWEEDMLAIMSGTIED